MELDIERRLIIISVPFYRIARVSLSEVVLGSLRESGDVVIVAPFAEEAGFIGNFGGPNTTFLKWAPNHLNRFQNMLYAISETMRMNGFWRRFKKYYFRNQYTRFGVDGQDVRLSPLRCFVYWSLSFVGQHPRAWAFVDRLLGTSWCRFPRLIECSRRYRHVTLIQSANWGMQDRALAVLSRVHGWRTVLLPYTTDQLDTNGYLLNEFDAVCVQGPYELKRAREYFAISASRTYRLGSAWFRHLEKIQAATIGTREKPRDDQGFILYAGVSATYFPRESEFEAVDAIIGLVSRLKKGHKLVYRPVELDESRKAQITRRYEGVESVALQWPSIAQLGLAQFSEVSQDCSLRESVDEMRGCRLVVMSSTTTLAMDVAFLTGCGVIANMADATGVLKKRNHALLDQEWFPGMRVANSIPELLENAEYLLNNPDSAAEEAAQLVALWDYRTVNFRDTLCHAVYDIHA